jgi:branched-chain amino acid transport system ATP-binding protein
MLEVRGIGSGYAALQVLWDVDLRVERGEWVALVGAAGAGKTTLLRTIAGVLEPVAGEVHFDGTDFAEVPAHQRVKRGLSLVPEGRRLFRGMTVAENLAAGAYVVHDRGTVAERLARVHELFPVLAERADQQVGTLSGGEQQMCAIGRALMAGPQLLLVDELSLGLAPVVVDTLLAALVRIRAEGTTLLIVEQDVETSLAYADRGYVLRQGRIVASGPSRQLLDDPGFLREYLGVTV